MAIQIKEIVKADQNQISKIIKTLWGDEMIIVHGEIFHTPDLSGLKAYDGDQIFGFLHYQLRGDECEILTLASLREGQGIGTTLLVEVERIARKESCELLSLITTNDNLNALGFYQRRGFHLEALLVGQVTQSRKLKPSIPYIGESGIPIRDEIRLVKTLT